VKFEILYIKVFVCLDFKFRRPRQSLQICIYSGLSCSIFS